MNTRKLTLLILMFLFSSLSFVEIVAQNYNRIGIGLNIGNSWGYKNNSGQLSLGLKLYYEGKISTDFSLKGNTELLLPMELFQFPIEASVLYNKNIVENTQYFIGIGTGYYWLVNNKDHGLFYYEKDVQVIYQPFKEGVIGVHGITGINIGSISIEFKYILLSVNQNETLYYQDPDLDTKKRVKKINLNTFRISFSYYFDF